MRVDPPLILLLETEDDLHWDDSLLRVFDLIRFGDGDCFSRQGGDNWYGSGHVLCVVYSYIWAETGLPLTRLVGMPSWYTPMAAIALSVRELTF